CEQSGQELHKGEGATAACSARQPLDGNERPWLWCRRLQRAGRRRYPASPDCSARSDEQRLRSGTTGQYGQTGKGCFKDRDARSCGRSRLLQQPGDPRVPRGRHYSDAAQTADVECQVRWTALASRTLFIYQRRTPIAVQLEQLPYRFTGEEDGKRIRRYWTTA